MKKSKFIFAMFLVLLQILPCWAAPVSLGAPVQKFDPIKNMGEIPQDRDFYVGIFYLSKDHKSIEHLNSMPSGTHFYELKDLDAVNNTATLNFIVKVATGAVLGGVRRVTGSSLHRYTVNISYRGPNVGLIIEFSQHPEEYKNGAWARAMTVPLEQDENGKFTLWPASIFKNEVGKELMNIFNSDQYDSIAEEINSMPETWDYFYYTSKNEQELAEFFANHNLLGDPTTWRYVFRKCDNDLRFERFLMKYNILSNEQNIPCKFIKVEMTNANQKAQYENKKYVATFGYTSGKIYVYSNDGKFIDYNKGDDVNLNIKISSCEYQSITSDSVTSVSDNENWRSWPDERGRISIDLIVIE